MPNYDENLLEGLDDLPIKPSLYPRLSKIKSWVTLIVSSVFSILLIGYQAHEFLGTLATKQDIEKISSHINSDIVKIQSEAIEAHRSCDSQKDITKEIEDALVDHLEKHAGILAADRIQDKRKAAKAAQQAREAFRRALKEGKTIKEALISSYDFYIF
jgi:hypothetical protein